MAKIKLDEDLNDMIKKNSDEAWEKAQRIRAEKEKEEKRGNKK